MSKQIQFDRLDTILALATAEYMRQETEAFLSAETDAALSEETERKINRMIRIEKGKKTRRKVWKVLRTVLIAALAAATVALAACVAHPEIREAIWKVVLTWGDESVKIDFVPANPNRKPGANSADNNRPTQKPNTPIPDAPKSIEAVRVPGYMPNGWTAESRNTGTIFSIDYYNADGESIITFVQMIIDSDSSVDANGATATELAVNGWDGVLLTYEDQPSVYMLYWQDYEYRYSFYGQFDSLDQLITMAESVYVEAGGFVEEAPKRIETIYAPSYMPQGWTTESVILRTNYMLVFYNQAGEYTITYNQMTISSKSHADAETGTATELTINGFTAVLFTYEDTPNLYNLYWQDNQYKYCIMGYVETVDELILMAESVYATSSHPTPPVEPEQPTEPANPPKSIEKVMIPGYMPAGYSSEGWLLMNNYMMVYYDASDKNVITYNQMIIDSNSYSDAEDATATDITINGWDGILLTYSDDPTEYVLYWQDTMYRYNIHGWFDSLAQLLRMAESVYDEAGAYADEPPKSIETIYAPSYMPSGYTTAGVLMQGMFAIDYSNQKGESVFAYQQTIIGVDSEGDAEGATATEITINGWSAVLLIYQDNSNIVNLYWQDSEYRYNIYGYFDSYDELIRFAESVYE